jgi:symplekin
MEKAAQEEKQRRAESRKRPSSSTAPQEFPDTKRAKLEDVSASAAFLAAFDFTKLPAALVTDLIVANLQAFSEDALSDLVRAYAEGKVAPKSDVAPPAALPAPSISAVAEASAAALAASHNRSEALTTLSGPSNSTMADVLSVKETSLSKSPSRSRSPSIPPVVKEEEEPVDPLKMDIDEEELEYEPDKLNMEVNTFFNGF